MRRSSLLLIAAIAVGSFFGQAASGQFPIRIPIPQIPKKETPAPAKTPEPRTETVSPISSPASTSSATAFNKNVRGIPIAGARITFSNNPDGSSPKTSFTSSEYIYGRLDLGGKTVYDAFGLKNQGNMGFYYISYDIQIWKPGEKPWDKWSGRNHTLVTKEDAQKTYWNFDVLPDPTKASTLQSGIADEIEYYHTGNSMYTQFYDVNSARSVFPQSGTYTVDITLFGNSYDDWGKSTGEIDKYPTVSAAFAFQFSGSDGQTLVANSEKAKENIITAKEKREMLRAMPSWWAGARTPAEPKLAPARLVPLIKGFIGQWNLTLLKHAVYPHSGPLWTIQKNSLGIPEYRMVVPYIYIIYKDPKEPDACHFGALYMRESYAGAGTYGSPYLGGIREVQRIDCAVVK